MEPSTFKCGHARTPDNTTMNGKYTRCRQCHMIGNRRAREHRISEINRLRQEVSLLREQLQHSLKGRAA